LREDPPKFAEDVSLFVLGDTGVVFSESAQEIYQLNATATYIWFQFEEGLSRSEAARELSQSFGISQDVAERHVREAIAGWEEHGVLAGTDTGHRSQIESSSQTALAAPAERIVISSLPHSAPARHYQVLDELYRIQFANMDLENWVHPLLQHLERPAREGGVPKLVMVSEDPSGYSIALDGIQVFRCTRIEGVGHLTDMAIFSDALRKTETALALHAGAVSQGDCAMILPGSGGSGKTTLTAALIHAGLHYLSDDLVLLDLERHTVSGVPFSLSIKEGGVEALQDRFPGLKSLPVHIRPDNKRVRYLPLDPDWRASEPCDPPRLSWIIFPTYDPKGANELVPMAPSRALMELTRGCTMMRHVTWEEVRGVISLIEGAECFEIEVSSLNRAIDQLIRLWHDEL